MTSDVKAPDGMWMSAVFLGMRFALMFGAVQHFESVEMVGFGSEY